MFHRIEYGHVATICQPIKSQIAVSKKAVMVVLTEDDTVEQMDSQALAGGFQFLGD